MGPCCEDKQTSCWAWAMDEQCDENPGFMRSTCPRSCSLCSDQQAAATPSATERGPRTDPRQVRA